MWTMQHSTFESWMSYLQVSAGGYHIVLRRSDGHAVAHGSNLEGQCHIPDLDAGVSYIKVSAGARQTVLLRNDGNAVAYGDNTLGQCENSTVITQYYFRRHVFRLLPYTVLCRSDGRTVACGLATPTRARYLGGAWVLDQVGATMDYTPSKAESVRVAANRFGADLLGFHLFLLSSCGNATRKGPQFTLAIILGTP